MNFKSSKFQGNNDCDGWLQLVELAPVAVMVVNEANNIMWMNAMAYTLFKVSTETMEDMLWDSLVFSLEPDGATPSDLLDTTAEYDSLGPFKAFITDSNIRVEVNVKKVQFGDCTYACCYLSPDTKYVLCVRCIEL
jgi:hypothetical protein